MLISFHFADTLLATSFIRSGSSGSLSSPAYLLPKRASEELPVDNEEKLVSVEKVDLINHALFNGTKDTV